MCRTAEGKAQAHSGTSEASTSSTHMENKHELARQRGLNAVAGDAPTEVSLPRIPRERLT